MTTGNYAIVEFVDEKAVEVVSGDWIETCDGVGTSQLLNVYEYCVHIIFVHCFAW